MKAKFIAYAVAALGTATIAALGFRRVMKLLIQSTTQTNQRQEHAPKVESPSESTGSDAKIVQQLGKLGNAIVIIARSVKCNSDSLEQLTVAGQLARNREDNVGKQVSVLNALVSQLVLHNKSIRKLYRSAARKLNQHKGTLRKGRPENRVAVPSQNVDKKIQRPLLAKFIEDAKATNLMESLKFDIAPKSSKDAAALAPFINANASGVVVAAVNVPVPQLEVLESASSTQETQKVQSPIGSTAHSKLDNYSTLMDLGLETSYSAQPKVEERSTRTIDVSTARENQNGSWVVKRFVSRRELFTPRAAAMLVLREVVERAETDDAIVLLIMIRAAEDRIASKYAESSPTVLFHRTAAERAACQSDESIPLSRIAGVLWEEHYRRMPFEQFRDQVIEQCVQVANLCRIRCV